MITLRLKDTNQLIGTIADADLQFLTDELEEESAEDTDYYIDAATIDMLEEDGAPASLIAVARRESPARCSSEKAFSPCAQHRPPGSTAVASTMIIAVPASARRR